MQRTTTKRRSNPHGGWIEDELEQLPRTDKVRKTPWGKSYKAFARGAHPSTAHTLCVYVVLVLLYAGLVWVTTNYSAQVPDPVPSSAPPHVFSEGRAYSHLEQLITNIGWRQAGTKNNDVHTVNWLLEKLNEIQEEAQKVGGVDRKLEIELQRGSSAYTLYFVDAYITNTYSNITNILVRVPAKNKQDQHSTAPLLLVNSHFDSGVGATGASDDGVATVACLEMIRNLVHLPPADYDVLFLFNGAEEPLLPASHAFVTQHPLAKRVKAVINLEAAGAGGPALAFQIGSADLAYAYCQAVPHPHTMVTAAEIFQSGVIPADTDYRIFRDFGEIPGIDMAFYRNGYVYHTPLDDLNMVTPGSIQHMGDNALALVRHLTDRERSDDLLIKPPNSRRAFYFSLFGVSVAYPAPAGLLLNVAAAALCLYLSLRFVDRTRLRPMFLGILLSSFVGLCSSIATAFLIGNILGHPLAFFARPWIGVCLHTAAFLLGFVFTLRRVMVGLFCKESLDSYKIYTTKSSIEDQHALNKESENAALHAGMLFFSLLSMLFSAFGILTSWFFMLQSMLLVAAQGWWLLYQYLASRFIHKPPFQYVGTGPNAVYRHDRHRSESVARVVFYALTIVPGTLSVLASYQVGIDMILPLLGRAGVAVPPDLVISGLTCLMAVCLIVPAMCVLISAGNLRYLIRILVIALVVLAVISLLAFPYGPTTPKRLIAQHTYHRPVQVIDKPGGSTHEAKAKISEMIAAFNRQDRSGKPDSDESFLLLGSFDYIPADIVFKDLATPPSIRPAEDVLYNFLPVYPFQPFMSAVQLQAGIPAGDLFTSGKVEHPTLRVIKDEFHSSTGIRTLVIAFDYTGYEISTLRLDATDSPLLEWGFSSMDDWRAGKVPHFTTPPPAARGDYFIRHIGGYGTREWVVLLRMNGLDPVRLDIAATHLKKTPEMEELERILPDWTTSYFFYSEVTTWIVE